MERKNILTGIGFLVLFLALGAYLKSQLGAGEEWMSSRQHGLWRAAHVHGTAFGMLNILLGILMAVFSLKDAMSKAASYLALVGLLMPIGLFLAGISGAFMFLSFIGGMGMILAWALIGVAYLKK